MTVLWKEKRRFPRVNLRTPIRCQIRGIGKTGAAITGDIGSGGVGFTSEEFVAPNTQVNLEINVLSRIIKPIGKVVSINHLSHSDKYRLGIEFLEISAEQKKYLQDYINLHTDRLYPN